LMETRLLPTDSPAACDLAIATAVELLRAGEVVALPTETVYGLACDATSPGAAAKVFEAKERPRFDPLIVHLPSRDWLYRIAACDDVLVLVEELTAAFWPGPLTLVLPRWALIPDIVTAGLDTVAVRMSAHPVFAAICREFGSPLAAPSANRFGRISPTAGEHVLAELGGRIPLIIDAGATEHGLESTIVAVEHGRLRILRAGPITMEELEIIAPVELASLGETPTAPGQLNSHYAPRTPLELRDSNSPEIPARAGLLAWTTPDVDHGFASVETLSATGDLREAAATFFAKLRRLDDAGLELIVAQEVPEHGLGIAIMERLRKAAAR